jgi:hypothetical protein
LRIASIATLPRENGRDAFAPDALTRSQIARFVVDQYVMFGWKTPLDVIDGLFLVNLDASIDRIVGVFEVILRILPYAVVVEQRIIDVYQEDDRMNPYHSELGS